ncbi:protein dead ringer [Nilaparvata lugens]|uniref:protein dead ringer n=1 Tax=Nilaparvata lugens TaxID=108931 RepID=UPI00193D93F1|nr:protein dead ringer [Nilaparvata lugens]
MEMDHRDSDIEGSVCSPDYVAGRRIFDNGSRISEAFCSPIMKMAQDSDNRSGAEMSENEEDSDDAIQQRHQATPPTPPTSLTVTPNSEHDIITKIKRERDELDRNEHAKSVVHSTLQQLSSGGGSASGDLLPPNFPLPLPFPFPPPAAFLQPAPAYPPAHHHQPPPTTAPGGLPPSSSSSESSTTSSSAAQQQTWSFEEQFKQVRQLYELSDDPKRKEFLDDLFSFMQRRGTPINRLPIMAKSVLDLYELYNLVIQRGGLVDVINKKLWQEIIKGLHLPSSITSAAFTLRTQYMKYLYPYECEKRRLSTPVELQAAIDGNRREGRRGSYGYGDVMAGHHQQRSPTQMSPLSLVTGISHLAPHHASSRPHLNGNSQHHHGHHHLLPMPCKVCPLPGVVPPEFEARMVEYVKFLNKELRNSASTPPNHRQNSPPGSPHEPSFSEMSRLSLWNLYHGGGSTASSPPPAPAAASHSSSPATPEPQKEPINLEKRESSSASPPAKRFVCDSPEPKYEPKHTPSKLPHIKISNKGDGRTSESSLVVTIDINGIEYRGVVFAQTPHTANNNNNSSNNNNTSTRHSS